MITPPLPTPRDASMAGCVWLVRFLAKARRLLADQLPPDYVERFGLPDGVDGHFFRFFGLSHEQMMDHIQHIKPSSQSAPSDAEFAAWFLTLPGIDAERIAAWNAFAERLGQPGYSMHDRLNTVLPGMADRLDTSKIHSIFDLITAEEAAN